MATRSAKQSTQDTSTVDATVVEETVSAELVESDGYSDTALKNIESFEDAANLAAETYGLANAADILGDGFNLVKGDPAKRRLVGQPMVVMEWKFYPGDFGAEFVAMRVVTMGDQGAAVKSIVTDGSTGIYQQLREMTDAYGRKGGMIVHSGLRESSYPFCVECEGAVKADHLAGNPDHHVSPKSTFYLDPTRKVLTA